MSFNQCHLLCEKSVNISQAYSFRNSINTHYTAMSIPGWTQDRQLLKPFFLRFGAQNIRKWTMPNNIPQLWIRRRRPINANETINRLPLYDVVSDAETKYNFPGLGEKSDSFSNTEKFRQSFTAAADVLSNGRCFILAEFIHYPPDHRCSSRWVVRRTPMPSTAQLKRPNTGRNITAHDADITVQATITTYSTTVQRRYDALSFSPALWRGGKRYGFTTITYKGLFSRVDGK